MAHINHLYARAEALVTCIIRSQPLQPSIRSNRDMILLGFPTRIPGLSVVSLNLDPGWAKLKKPHTVGSRLTLQNTHVL